MLNKKLLTAFCLVVGMLLPQGVWATETLTATEKFSLTTAQLDESLNTTVITSGTGITVSGGTFEAKCRDYTNENGWFMGKQTNDFKNMYIEVTVNEALQDGDVITFSYTQSETSSNLFTLWDSKSRSSNLGNVTGYTKTGTYTVSVIVSETNSLIGRTTFCICPTYNNMRTVYVKSLKVYSGSTVALTADKDWNFFNYNTHDATTNGFSYDNLFFGKGISIATISSTNVLNLPKNGTSFDATNSLVMFKVNGKGKVTFTYYANASGTKPFAHYIGGKDETKENLGGKEFKTTYFTFDVADDTPIYLYTADNASGTFYLKSINVTFAPEISINTIDYATFSSSEALDFTGLSQKAYIVTAQSDGKLTYQQVNKVPAETGLLIVGADGETVKPAFLAKGDAAETITTNLLKPTLTATTVGTTTGADYGKVWVLGNKNSTPGFYKSNNGRSLAVGKAYLYLDGGISEAREFYAFDFEDETTGISNSKLGIMNSDQVIFDLQGRRVAQPTKGLYIVNGKKVVIK